MLSQSTIQELQQIIKKDYGKKVSMEEASDIAYCLVDYFDLSMKVYARMKSVGKQKREEL